MNTRQDFSPFGVVWFLSGVLLLALLVVRSFALAEGSPFAKLGAGGVLGLFILFSLLLLARKESASSLSFLFFPVAAAFFLRLFLLDHQSLDYQDFLAHWAAFFRENGGLSALGEPVGNYNVPYLCFLALLSYLRVPDLYAIKLFSILFDVLLYQDGHNIPVLPHCLYSR